MSGDANDHDDFGFVNAFYYLNLQVVLPAPVTRRSSSASCGMWVNEVCNHGVRISPSTGPPAMESVAGIFDRGQLFMEPAICVLRSQCYIERGTAYETAI